MTSISVTLRDDTAKGLAAIAEQMDRSRSWIVNEALQNYLAQQAWMDRETDSTIAAIDAGTEPVIPHAEVMARLEARQQARKK
jgi:RHH-type rel operon transcriptional repressor/antitoxin RelB